MTSSNPSNPFTDTDYTAPTYIWPVDVLWDGEAPKRSGSSTGPLVTIDYAHHETHASNMYIVTHKLVDTDSLADDASLDLHMILSTDYDCHAVFWGAIGGDFEGILYEGPTCDTDGSAFTPINMDRGSTDASSVTVQINPTVNAVGDKLMDIYAPGGEGPRSGGAIAALREGTEWILGAGNEYLVRITNRAGAAKMAAIGAQWYEESA